jgi:hypothetical protein
MASTGQQITYNGNYYLKIRWDITSQSVANNRSGVRVRMYIGANSGWSLSDSSNSWTLGVASSSFSGSNVSVSINGSEKLLADEQVFVDHNSDGTKNIAINGSVSGFYFGGINPASFTATLDAIPRASTSSSSASWTATNSLSVGISRADSSFTHTVRVYVGSTLVGTNTGVTTSTSFNSTAFHTNVVTAMGSSSTATARYEIDTFSGSSQIGSTYSRSGTVTAPSMSTISVPSSFDVGSTLNFTISRDNTEFSHKVELFWGATAIATDVELKNSISASLATSGLYSRITTSNSGTVTIRITTYYGDTQNSNTQIRTHINYTATARIVNSDPTPPTTLTYAISGYTAITGNTTNVIVQGKTSVSVTFNAGSARNSATITGYNIKVNGRQDLPVGASGTHSLGVLNTSGSGSIVVEIIDSRGNKASISTPITVIPYQSPAQSSTIRRDDGFGAASTLTVKGIMSDVKVSGARKNYIKSIQYRVKTSPATTFPTTYTPISVGTNGASVTYDNAGGFTIAHALTLADDKSHEIEVIVTDAFDGQSSTTQGKNLSLSTGKPLFWLDTDRLSVGVNAFPAINDTFEVGGAGIRTTALNVSGNATISQATIPILNSTAGTFAGTLTANSSFITNSNVTMNTGGTINIGVGTTTANSNQGSIRGNLTHTKDYFNIRSFDTAVYGAGQAEIWYSDTDNRVRFASRSDATGTIRTTKVAVGTIETNSIVLDSASQLSLPNTSITTLEVVTGITAGGSISLTGATATVNAYAVSGRDTDNLRVRSDGEVVFLRRSSTANTNIRASTVFYSTLSQTSQVATKTNLEDIENRIDSLELINNSKIWHYHLKTDIEEGAYDKPKVGLLYEMSHPILRNDGGIDLYSMLSISWKAVQQLSDENKKLSSRVKDLERVLGVMVDEESNV